MEFNIGFLENYTLIINKNNLKFVSYGRHTESGDTLINANDNEKFMLSSIQMPPPCFMASIEFESLKDKSSV